MELNIFRHALNIDFSIAHPEMSKAENEYFSEAFAHYHNIMSEYNNQYISNTIWLNENFMKLWNKYGDPKEVLDEVVKHMVKQSNKDTTRKEI